MGRIKTAHEIFCVGDFTVHWWSRVLSLILYEHAKRFCILMPFFSLMTEWFSPGSDQWCVPCSDFPWIVLWNILNRIATKVFFACNFKCNYFSLLWTFRQYSYVEVLLKTLVYLCNWIRSCCQFARRNFCQFWWWKLLKSYSFNMSMENNINEFIKQPAKVSWERNRGWSFFSGFLRQDLNICCNTDTRLDRPFHWTHLTFFFSL